MPFFCLNKKKERIAISTWNKNAVPLNDVNLIIQQLFSLSNKELRALTENGGIAYPTGVPTIYGITNPLRQYGSEIVQFVAFDQWYHLGQEDNLPAKQALLMQHALEFPRLYLERQPSNLIGYALFDSLFKALESKECKKQLLDTVRLNMRTLDYKKVRLSVDKLLFVALELNGIIRCLGRIYFNEKTMAKEKLALRKECLDKVKKIKISLDEAIPAYSIAEIEKGEKNIVWDDLLTKLSAEVEAFQPTEAKSYYATSWV